MAHFSGNPNIPIFSVIATGRDGKEYNWDGVNGADLGTLREVIRACCGRYKKNGFLTGIDLQVTGDTIRHSKKCRACELFKTCSKER